MQKPRSIASEPVKGDVPHKARSVEVCIILWEENWTNIFKYCSFPLWPDYFSDLTPNSCEKYKHLALTLWEMRIHWKLHPKWENEMLISPLLSYFFLHKIFLLKFLMPHSFHVHHEKSWVSAFLIHTLWIFLVVVLCRELSLLFFSHCLQSKPRSSFRRMTGISQAFFPINIRFL